MGRSVAEIRRHLDESQHVMLVWEKVVDYLSACVDTEAREARSNIVGSREATPVPQGIIEKILQDIEAEKIAPLRAEIAALENLPVMEIKHGNEKSERPAARSKADAKRVRVVAKPG
jgi:hypothetical protein